MNEESEIFVLTEKVVQEAIAGTPLLVENGTLAQAGVNEQTKTKGQIAFPGEKSNRLRTAIFLERKIVFGEIRNDFAVLVMNGSKDIDGVHLHRDFGISALLWLGSSRWSLRLCWRLRLLLWSL